MNWDTDSSDRIPNGLVFHILGPIIAKDALRKFVRPNGILNSETSLNSYAKLSISHRVSKFEHTHGNIEALNLYINRQQANANISFNFNRLYFLNIGPVWER